MENKNFMTLTEDELYGINGGRHVSGMDVCTTAAKIAYAGILSLAGPAGFALEVTNILVENFAEPADPKPGDVVHAGGYTLTVSETGGYEPISVSFGPDPEKHKNTSTSNTSSQKSSNKSSK